MDKAFVRYNRGFMLFVALYFLYDFLLLAGQWLIAGSRLADYFEIVNRPGFIWAGHLVPHWSWVTLLAILYAWWAHVWKNDYVTWTQVQKDKKEGLHPTYSYASLWFSQIPVLIFFGITLVVLAVLRDAADGSRLGEILKALSLKFPPLIPGSFAQPFWVFLPRLGAVVLEVVLATTVAHWIIWGSFSKEAAQEEKEVSS